MYLSRLVTLSISPLRNLAIEVNKFDYKAHPLYDTALLTRRYTQRALLPYIDSDINHITLSIAINLWVL